MDGTCGLRNFTIFEEWYSAICDNLKEETVREGLVPSTTYIAISTDDGRLIGMIDVRHNISRIRFGIDFVILSVAKTLCFKILRSTQNYNLV